MWSSPRVQPLGEGLGLYPGHVWLSSLQGTELVLPPTQQGEEPFF